MNTIKYYLTYLLYVVTLFTVLLFFEAGLHTDLFEYFLEDEKEKSKPQKQPQENKNSFTHKIRFELDDEFLGKLQKGGFTIYIRHTHKAEWSTNYSYDRISALISKDERLDLENFGGCISEQGKKDAVLLGIILKNLKLPVGTIYSSTSCRTIQTALIAMGKIDKVSSGLLFDLTLANEQEKEERTELGKEIINTVPTSNKNKFIFGHLDPISELQYKYESPEIGQGGAYIFEHMKDGSTRIVKQLNLDVLAKAVPIEFYVKDY